MALKSKSFALHVKIFSAVTQVKHPIKPFDGMAEIDIYFIILCVKFCCIDENFASLPTLCKKIIYEI